MQFPRVRGTVHSLKNTDKNKHLYNLCPDSKHKLELVEADLTKDDSWLRFVHAYVVRNRSFLLMLQLRCLQQVFNPYISLASYDTVIVTIM